MKMPQIDFGGLGHSAVLRILPLTGSLNGQICGSITLAQICSAIAPQTSHIPKTLGDMLYKIKEVRTIWHL